MTSNQNPNKQNLNEYESSDIERVRREAQERKEAQQRAAARRGQSSRNSKRHSQSGKPKKRDWSFYAIVISLILIAIPVTLITWEIIVASTQQGKPILGDRFEGDLDPAITQEQEETLKTNLSSLAGVKEANVDLKTATLRITLLVDSSIPDDKYPELANEAYKKVGEVLPIATYFTTVKPREMYDLEIHLFNMDKPTPETENSLIYYLLNKSALMPEPKIQALSKPVSPEMKKRLQEIQEERDNPTVEDPLETTGRETE